MDPVMAWPNASRIVARVFAPRSRGRAWLILGLMVAVIGIADYFSSIEVLIAIFYLVPISLATGWRGPRTGVALALLGSAIRVGSDLVIVHPDPVPEHEFWNVASTLVIFLFVIWLLHALITVHRELEQKVMERTSDLQKTVAALERLQHELLEVGARERNAIGRELHDDLGQHLVATAMAAQVLARGLDQAGSAGAQSIVRWIEEAIAKSRKLARGLLLDRILPERFPQELEELAATASQAGVPCRVVHHGREVGADPAECAQLFRVAQEAVGNALRHAGAKGVTITLAGDERALCLMIEDDGLGFAADASGKAPSGMGLRIMEHRAKVIGASLSLLSQPGEGTKVLCQLPRRIRTKA